MNLFVDGSYSPSLGKGIGAYIILSDKEVENYSCLTIAELKKVLSVSFCVVENINGCTQVEEYAVMHGLTKCNSKFPTIWTDCQQICQTYPTAQYIKGHAKQSERVGLEKIFDIVDKSARKELRRMVREEW